MSFCVECGATVKTFQGLCPKCFAEHRRLIEPPETIDVVRCSGCDRLRVDKSWVKSDINDVILQLLEQKVPTSKEVTFRTFTFKAKEEDERNILLTVKVILRVDDFEVLDSFASRLRIHGGMCPPCGKRAGFYYEAILQVRAEGRSPSPDEEREIIRFIEERVGRTGTGDAFVTKVEPVRGGIDFYLSSHELGKNLAKEIKAMHGGKVSVSPRLYGQMDGKEVYRTTHLVRLPRYRIGDVVRVDGRLYEVLGLGFKPLLRDLKTGKRRSVKESDMKRAKMLDYTRSEVKVTANTDKVIEFETKDHIKTSRASRPLDYEDAEGINIVAVGEEKYVSAIKGKDSSRGK